MLWLLAIACLFIGLIAGYLIAILNVMAKQSDERMEDMDWRR